MTNPYTELAKEVRNGCLDLSALQSILAQRQYDIQRQTYHLLCLLTWLIVIIALGLVSLELHLTQALDAHPITEQVDRSREVHPDVSRPDPARSATPDRDSSSFHYVL
jgi:hypothetical protein